MSEVSDLDHPDKIATLVRTFYGRVQKDDLLSPVFVDQAQVDWDLHIPKLIKFWCQIGLGIPGFKGAPTQKHSALSRVMPFRAEQFARWVELFHDTVDGGWAGPCAESIKASALSIAKIQSQAVEGAESWDGI